MSRFVEGSMSDRTSAVPPVTFVGWQELQELHGARSRRPETASTAAPLALFARRSMQVIRPSATPDHISTPAESTAETTAETTTGPARRPRSFLAPLWDGVTRHLPWRTRSNAELEGEQAQQQQPQTAPFHLQGQPSPDEVLANYHQLVQAGFFSKRAIPATRQGLAGGAAVGGTAAETPTTLAAEDARPISATLSRGIKRGHIDDDDNDDDHDDSERNNTSDARRNQAADVAPATDAVDNGGLRYSLRSRGQQPRKLRKSAEGRAHHHHRAGDRPLTSSGQRPVAAQQEMPRASQRLAQREVVAGPAPVAAQAPAGGRRTLSKKRKSSTSGNHSGRSREQMQMQPLEQQWQQQSVAGENDDSDSHIPKRKKRTIVAQTRTAPVVVLHQEARQQWRLEQTLLPRPEDCICVATEETTSSALPPPPPPPPPQPISFHYPQRVRVRRPLQDATQGGVRLRAQGAGKGSAGKGSNSSSTTTTTTTTGEDNQSKQTGRGSQGHRDSLELLPKPRTAAMLEDEENVAPLF